MGILPQYKLNCIAIPRCGSTAIFNSLNGFGGNSNDKHQIKDKRFLFQHGHYSYREYLAQMPSYGLGIYDTFTFVRNPYHRAISIFYYDFQKWSNVPINKWKEYGKVLNNAKKQDIHGLTSETFDAFCRLRIEDSEYIHSSWKTQVWYLLNKDNNLDSISFIGKIENFDTEWERLRMMYPQIPVFNPKCKNANKTRSNYKSRVSRIYTHYSKKTVQDVFKEDFDMFGYSYDLPEDEK